MRLIDADALPRHGQRGGLVHWQDIENAPTTDAAPATSGTWVEKDVSAVRLGDQVQSARCSSCGRYHTTPYLYSFNEYPYCPWCGAKMEGGKA